MKKMLSILMVFVAVIITLQDVHFRLYAKDITTELTYPTISESENITVKITSDCPISNGSVLKKVPWYIAYKKISLQLGFNFNPVNISYAFVEWSSNNSNVLIDKQSGKITNIKMGSRSAIITLKLLDENKNIIAYDSINVIFYKFNFQLKDKFNTTTTQISSTTFTSETTTLTAETTTPFTTIPTTAPEPTEPIIGVRFKQVVDEVADYIKPCERLGNAIGLTSSDFDSIPPFNKIRRCNIQALSNGSDKITYEGDTGFSLDGSNGNVFVEIPKHYIKRFVSGGFEYRYISSTPIDGYIVDPVFIENGKELNAVYVSAYEGYVQDGKLRSVSGVYPTANYTRTQFRDFAKANGTGYGILDIRTLNMLQNLFIIEFASLNVQDTIGGGWGMIYQPSVARFRAVISEKNTNRIIIGDWSDDYKSCLFVGSAIQCINYNSPQNVLMTGHTITSIAYNTPQTGQTAINFDGAPVNVTTNFVLGGAAQKCGWSDTLTTKTGKTQNHGTNSDSAYLNAVRYRYMENLWGNLWKWLDGINLLNGQAYYAENMSDYESDKTSSPYKPISESLELQTSNGTVGGQSDIHYLKNLTYDSSKPALALPKNYVNQGETSIPADQTTPKLGGNALRANHFGDYYYLNTEATCYAYGGGFDHYWRGGLFTLRGWWTNSTSWYLTGSRLLYKPI